MVIIDSFILSATCNPCSNIIPDAESWLNFNIWAKNNDVPMAQIQFERVTGYLTVCHFQDTLSLHLAFIDHVYAFLFDCCELRYLAG